MVMLGAYVGVTGIVPFEALVDQAKHEFEKKPKLLPVNLKCLGEGYRVGRAAATGQ
ncbi:pyruvate ferredoxin oxidoreductase, partial [candidate division WOR-3 bacterium]|nr:pyruvate ferredoxin oxidoreductase [candidate division WOR-3 bacterium]